MSHVKQTMTTPHTTSQNPKFDLMSKLVKKSTIQSKLTLKKSFSPFGHVVAE